MFLIFFPRVSAGISTTSPPSRVRPAWFWTCGRRSISPTAISTVWPPSWRKWAVTRTSWQPSTDTRRKFPESSSHSGRPRSRDLLQTRLICKTSRLERWHPKGRGRVCTIPGTVVCFSIRRISFLGNATSAVQILDLPAMSHDQDRTRERRLAGVVTKTNIIWIRVGKCLYLYVPFISGLVFFGHLVDRACNYTSSLLYIQQTVKFNSVIMIIILFSFYY